MSLCSLGPAGISVTIRRHSPRSCGQHGSETLRTANMMMKVLTPRRELDDGSPESRASTRSATSSAGKCGVVLIICLTALSSKGGILNGNH